MNNEIVTNEDEENEAPDHHAEYRDQEVRAINNNRKFL